MKRRLWLCGIFAVMLIAAVLLISSCDFDNECAHDASPYYDADDESHWQHCTICGEELGREAHQFEEIEEYYNCDYTESYEICCTICGAHSHKEVGPVGHNIVDGQCTRCEQGFYFELNDDGQSYTVAGYSHIDQSETEIRVEIPSSFRGLPVTVIGEGLFNFYGEMTLISVTIPDSIIVIEERAFQNAEITEIIIPEGVTTIGAYAFSDSKITSLTLPDSVTVIGASAFRNTPIESLTLSEGLVTIDSYAFSSCDNLTSISIPDSVTTVGECAFARCTSVTELTLGENLTTIGDRAFFGLTNLEKLYYNSKAITSVGRYVMWGYGPISNENFSHDYCYPEKTYELYIGENVDYFATAITVEYDQVSKIHVPSIEFWMGLAFAEVSAEGVCINDRQPTGSEGLYINGEPITEIIIPESFTQVLGHFRNCNYVKNIVIHDNVTYVDSFAFRDLSGVESLTIGAGVTSAGELAFGGLVNLKELYFNAVDLGDYSTHYTSGTFVGSGSENENGYTLYIGSEVESIPSALSHSNIGVAKVPSVSVLIKCGAGNLSAADEIEIEGGFDGTLVIPEDITVIEDYAFGYWKNLTEVVFHDGVTEIGYGAFDGCENLASVKGLPAGVKIKDGAFRDTSISEITIPAGAIVGGDVFTNAGLTKVVISDGVEIGTEAFRANDIEVMVLGDDLVLHNLTFNQANVKRWEINGDSYELGEDVFYMGYGSEQWDHITVSVAKNANIISEIEKYRPIHALELNMSLAEYCSTDIETANLFYDELSETTRDVSFAGEYLGEELIIPEGVTHIGKNAFRGAKITSVTIPDSVTSIGERAFAECAYLESIKGGVNVSNCGDYAVNYDLIEPSLIGGVYYKFDTIVGIESSNLVSVVIREGTKEIPARLFEGCGNLIHVYVPAGCTIGDRAFINTNTYITILFEEENYPGGDWKILLEQNGRKFYIGNSYDMGVSNLIKLGDIEYGITYDEATKFAYKYDQYLTYPGAAIYGYFGEEENVAIPETLGGNTVTTIEDWAFVGLSFKSVTMPDCVKKINDQAFYFCHSLESVKMPGVEVVGPIAFYDCPALKTVEMNSATHLGSGAFYQCKALESITLPATIKYINNGAFQDCTALKSVTFEDDSHSWYIVGSDQVILSVDDPELNAKNLVIANIDPSMGDVGYALFGWVIDTEVNEGT